jgi:hypothetical protein
LHGLVEGVGKQTVNTGTPNPELPRNRRRTETRTMKLPYLDHGDARLASAIDAPRLGLRDTLSLALTDDGPLELSEGAKQLKLKSRKGVFGRGREAQALCEKGQTCTLRIEPLEHALQVDKVSSQAVNAVNDHFVTLARKLYQSVKLGSLGTPPRARLFLEHLLATKQLLAVEVLLI